MVFGCGYEVYKTGYKGIEFEDYSLVNLENFSNLFGIVIIAYCFHHCVPALIKPIHPQKEVKWVMKRTFMISFSIFLSLAFCGVCAFGIELINLKEVHFISFNFTQNEIILFYFAAVYIFLNVIAFPVFVITVRNNLMKLISPSKIPKISSEITPYTFAFTVGILLFVIIISSLASNIKFVLNFIGGTVGVIIIFVAPPLYVIKGRKILRE